MTDKKPTHIAIFKVTVEEKTVYYVQATEKGTVRGWENERDGLAYFTTAWEDAHRRGGGWTAGAIFDHMTLRPKVYNYGGNRDHLVELLGETVHPIKLTATGVRETVFQIPDQALAARLYETATEPKPHF